MTFLAVTVKTDGVIVSQDSHFYQKTDEYIERSTGAGIGTFDESVKSIYVGDGNLCSPRLIGRGCKIALFPDSDLVVAITGDNALATRWRLYLPTLCLSADRNGNDIVTLNQIVPEHLHLMASMGEGIGETVLVHAGYSAVLERGCAFAYASADNFEPREIPIGQTLAPAPDPSDESYERIFELYQRANRGDAVTDLHQALMSQQLRAFQTGRLGAGAGIGGALHQATVTRGSINITTVPFDGESEAR